jgi:probable blue pigment (indigoidine) exporter
MKESKTALITLLAPVLWGTTYLAITELLPPGRPLQVASMRVVPAGLVLVALGTLGSRQRPRFPDWGRTASLALFNVALFFPLLVVAVQRLPGGTAAAVGGTQPLLVAGLGRVLAGRPIRRRDLLVGIVAVVGVALVVLRPGAGLDHVGLLAAVAANLAFATGVVLTKRFPAPTDRVTATGWQLLLGGAVLVPLAFVVDGPLPALSGRSVVGIAYLSLVATALAFVLWFDGIRRLPGAAPPLLGLAAPVTGAALGWIVRGEALSPIQLLGFAITLGAIAHGARLPSPASAAARRLAPRQLRGLRPRTPSPPGSLAVARSAAARRLAPHRPHRRAALDVDLGDRLEPEPSVQGAAARRGRLEVRRGPVGVHLGQRVGEQRAAEPSPLGCR